MWGPCDRAPRNTSTIQGDNTEELLRWAPRVFQTLRRLPELTDVTSDQQNKGLEARLVIDRETAARLGISPQMIDDTLYDAFGQRPVSTMYTQLNQYHVIMEVDPQFWQSPDGLKEIYVRAKSGPMVPLAAFSHYERSTAPLSVNHQGQFPSVTISFNLPAGVALGNAVDAINRAQADLRLPGSIRGSFQGTAQAFRESLANQPILIAAAVFAVYIVLGVLYESFIHPITILSTLPSAGVGALLALLLFGNDFRHRSHRDHSSDRHRQEERDPDDRFRDRGGTQGKQAKPEEAIEGCLLRFRPIGDDDDLWRDAGGLLWRSNRSGLELAGRSASRSSADCSCRSS